MFALLVLAFIATVQRSEQIEIIGYLRNGNLIPFEVSVNENFATAVSGQPIPPQSFFRQSVNLYDFEKKLEARKVIQDGACYIRQFNATAEQFKKMVDNAKMSRSKLTDHVSEDWNHRGLELKGDNLETTVGPLIKAFCSDYKIYGIEKVRTGAPRSASPRVKRQLTYDQGNRRNNTGSNRWAFNRLNRAGSWLASLFNRRNDTNGNGWYFRETVDRDQNGRPTGFGSETLGFRNQNIHGRVSSGNRHDRGQFVDGSLDYSSSRFNATGQLGLDERGGLRGRGRFSNDNLGIEGNMTVEYDGNRFSASAGFEFNWD